MEHHVYFWLKKKFKGEAARAAFEQALEDLLEIGSIAEGCWGRPAKTPAREVVDGSWDYGLSFKFDKVADHNAYQDDPAHHEFVEAFKERWEKVLVMDLG